MNSDCETLTSGTEEEKEAAATRLIELGRPALECLRSVIAQHDSDARWWAVRALAGIDGKAATGLLVSALTDPDEDVVTCAVMGIGERKEADPHTLACLTSLLRRSGPYLGRHISDALSKIGEAAVPDLLSALEDGSPAVRSLAARALARIESRQAIPALIKALDDPEPTVEYFALDGLERMGVGSTFFVKF